MCVYISLSLYIYISIFISLSLSIYIYISIYLYIQIDKSVCSFLCSIVVVVVQRGFVYFFVVHCAVTVYDSFSRSRRRRLFLLFS